MFNQPPKHDPQAAPPAPYGQPPYQAHYAYQVPAAPPLPPIGRYRALAVFFLVLGLVLPLTGFFMGGSGPTPAPLVAMIYVGVAMNVLACALLMKSKGQSMIWGLFGLLGLVAFLVMLLVPNRYKRG